MEALIQLIFVLALLKYCIKAALTRRTIAIVIYAFVAAIIAICFYPFVVKMPGNIISLILAKPKMIADGAVLITVEAISGILISVKLLDNYFLPKQKRKKHWFVVKVLPGIIFIFALLYFELLFMKFRVGKDFLISSIIYSVIVLLSISAMSFIFSFSLKRESVKLEMKMLLNMFILITGLLVHSAVADYNISYAKTKIEWLALITMIIIVVTFFIIGFVIAKYRKNKSIYLNKLYNDKLDIE